MKLDHQRTESMHSNIQSSSSYQPLTMKDTLSYQIDSALKQYESLQNKLSAIKGKSYTNMPYKSPHVSKPQTPLIKEIKTPNNSKVNQSSDLNQKEQNTPSSKNVMNEFRAILQESEMAILNKYPKYTPQYNINPSLMNYQQQQQNPQQQQQQQVLHQQCQRNPQSVQCELFQMTNQVLNKSNLDLKNFNRVLEIELNSFKTKSSTIPLSQYDTKVNLFIDTLKTSLNTSQMSNKELNDMYNFLKEDNAKLAAENTQIEEQMEIFQKENDETFSKNQDISSINTNFISKCNEIDNENKLLIKEIEDFQLKVSDQKVKNSNLDKVNQSYNTLQFNNEEVLQQLKSTIDNLKKKNEDSNKEKEDNSKQLAYINNELKAKEEEVDELKAKLDVVMNNQNDLRELDRDYHNKVNAKTDEVFNYDNTMKNMINDIEKVKSNSKVLLQVIEDREKTIGNLNESLKFINTNITSPLEQSPQLKQSSFKSGIELKKKALNDILKEIKEKEDQLSEIKKNYEEIIKLKNDKITLLTSKNN